MKSYFEIRHLNQGHPEDCKSLLRRLGETDGLPRARVTVKHSRPSPSYMWHTLDSIPHMTFSQESYPLPVTPVSQNVSRSHEVNRVLAPRKTGMGSSEDQPEQQKAAVRQCNLGDIQAAKHLSTTPVPRPKHPILVGDNRSRACYPPQPGQIQPRCSIPTSHVLHLLRNPSNGCRAIH